MSLSPALRRLQKDIEKIRKETENGILVDFEEDNMFQM